MQRVVLATSISTYSCSTVFDSPAGEGLFGLGCHPLDSGSIDYKGRDQDLLIKYMTGAIPVLLSTAGYGLLWDNYSASKFFGNEGGGTAGLPSHHFRAWHRAFRALQSGRARHFVPATAVSQPWSGSPRRRGGATLFDQLSDSGNDDARLDERAECRATIASAGAPRSRAAARPL